MTMQERGDQVVDLMRDGWRAVMSNGYASNVRLRLTGSPERSTGYQVMRYLERTRRVRRHKTATGVEWTLREEA